MTMHKLKLLCTNSEVIRWKRVDIISIFVGGIFLLVTQEKPCHAAAATVTTITRVLEHLLLGEP